MVKTEHQQVALRMIVEADWVAGPIALKASADPLESARLVPSR